MYSGTTSGRVLDYDLYLFLFYSVFHFFIFLFLFIYLSILVGGGVNGRIDYILVAIWVLLDE